MNLLIQSLFYFCALGIFGGATLPSSTWAQGSPNSIGEPTQSDSDEARQKAIKTEELRRISLEIERRLGKGTRYVTPASPESSLRDYVEHFKQEIERNGSENFPKRNGASVYGRILMSVTVSAKGKVERAVLLKGSDKFLEAHAKKILKDVVGRPFSPDFPAGTLRIVFTTPFVYLRE